MERTNKNKSLILLKALFLSTSGSNILKYSTDKNKRKNVKMGIVGPVVLYVCLAAFVLLYSISIGKAGFSRILPSTTVLLTTLVCFFFTLLKTNGYLFAFKEYDMLMAMPFKVSTVVLDKFLYMYIKALPIQIIVSLGMLAGFIAGQQATAASIIIWVVLSPFIPLIPSVISSALGALIAKVGAGFKYKKAVQTVLLFVFVFACIFSRFFIEAFFKNGEDLPTEDIANIMDSTAAVYRPAKWFTDAVYGNFLSLVIFLVVSVGMLALFAWLVSRSYRKINSGLKSSSSHGNYKVKTQDVKSPVRAIAFKELRRFLGSPNYMVNAGVGQIFAIIVGVAAIFVDGDKLIATVLQGAPVSKEIIIPAIPVIIYLFIGMVSTACVTPSLEGKNYWILKSMPVKAMDVYRGKMLFSLDISIPFALFATLTLSISFGAGVLMTVLNIICVTVMCLFSTFFGMVCGIRHMRLDWENEIEVIKQGSAVTTYLLPNMVITMILIPGSAFGGTVISPALVVLFITVIYGIFAFLCYNVVKKLAAGGLA